MQIKNAIYENLSHSERVIATVEALARKDDAEKTRLIKTCPKKTYMMNDSAYANKMEALEFLMVIVEFDMRGAALNLMVSFCTEPPADAEQCSLYHRMCTQPEKVKEILCIHEAWCELLREEGLSPHTINKAFGEAAHGVVRMVIFIAEDHEIKADPERVKAYKALLRGYLDKI